MGNTVKAHSGMARARDLPGTPHRPTGIWVHGRHLALLQRIQGRAHPRPDYP